MAHPRLFWRNGTAYFRPKYPIDLRHLFASEQRWVSLRTKCRCEAAKKVKVVDLAFDAEMDALRAAEKSGDVSRLRLIRDPVSTTETDRVISAREVFWSIVTPRSDDETEADDARQFGGRGDQGHPAGHAAALVS